MDKENLRPNQPSDYSLHKVIDKRERFAESLRVSKKKQILKVKRQKNLDYSKIGHREEIVMLIKLIN